MDYLGNIRLSGNQDLEFATIDCDKSVLVNIKHDDKLDEKIDSVLQFAMLYPLVSYFFFYFLLVCEVNDQTRTQRKGLFRSLTHPSSFTKTIKTRFLFSDLF